MLDNDSFKIEGIWLRGKGMINIMTIVDMVISPHKIFKYEPLVSTPLSANPTNGQTNSNNSSANCRRIV